MRKVFVSSVVGGFEEFRDAANRGITLTGNLPVMCETFGSRPHNSETACLSEVDSCDVFILLVGQRYGFVPDTDSVSVTHREYLTARETGKTILVFVQAGKKESKQAEFCNAVEDYSTGYFRSEFSSAEELKELVVQSLVQLDAEAKAEPEESFRELVEQSRETMNRNWQLGTNDETQLQIGFWRQPSASNDIVAIESDADKIFLQMCDAGLATLRGGYEVVADSEYTAIKTGNDVLVYFANGLVLFRLNPKIYREGFDHDMFFIAPSRVRELCLGAGQFLTGRSAWSSVLLSGMQSRNFEELPQQRLGSVSIGSGWGNTEKEICRLFSPFSPVEYEQWIDNSIELMKRMFSQ